tara:strand:- start:6402 stop:6710 length:309 start_codon:yes stop_codon:yes gene_type:complete
VTEADEIKDGKDGRGHVGEAVDGDARLEGSGTAFKGDTQVKDKKGRYPETAANFLTLTRATGARPQSALAGLEAAVRLVDDVDTALAAHETVVPVAVPQRPQ